jgi:hypothetical protein
MINAFSGSLKFECFLKHCITCRELKGLLVLCQIQAWARICVLLKGVSREVLDIVRTHRQDGVLHLTVHGLQHGANAQAQSHFDATV